MLKFLPTIIISSTISYVQPIDEQVFYLDGDYSLEAIEFMRHNKIKDSQDTSNILYDLIRQELEKENNRLYQPK